MRNSRAFVTISCVLVLTGCTLVSGGDDLQIYETGDPLGTCSACSASAECESANCRQVECNGGQQVTLCLPEDADESTPPASVACDWDVICP